MVQKVSVARYVCYVILTLLSLAAESAVAADDLHIPLLRTFGLFEGGERGGVLYLNDRKVTLKEREVARLEISEYNPIDGANPDLIDVVATVSNKGEKSATDIEVRITVSPKVASLTFIEGLVGSGTDPSTADVEATERTAEWFAPILLLRKTIGQLPGGASGDVVFEKIDLKSIIRGYVARKLWPTVLRIDASVEPKGREDDLRNNTATRYFRIKLPPY